MSGFYFSHFTILFSAVAAIDKVIIKYHQNGVKVHLMGRNKESSKLIEKLAVHNKPGGLEKAVRN